MTDGCSEPRVDVDPATLRLPVSPTPRQSERIICFRRDAPVTGVLLGHGADGRPRMNTDFGTPFTPRGFHTVRREDPFAPLGPNWTRLPATAAIVRLTEQEHAHFDDLLNQRTPPGPKYLELMREIW